MFEDNENKEWESWKDPMPENFMGGMSVESLRDHALDLFGRYLSDKLRVRPPVRTPEIAEQEGRFLSVEETEAILRDHSVDVGAPPGAYAIGGHGIRGFKKSFIKLMNALMERIMSNLTNEAVNRGLVDCAFDAEADAFAFSITPAGEQMVNDLRAKLKTVKKNKATDDSSH